jgi:hypothetical protein
MIGTKCRQRRHHPRIAVLTAAVALLVTTAAGAAERVVLGEYFTNLF